jgi:hypothetical protein
MGVAPGIHAGRATHWDIPAAYASTLGAMRYGGWWRARDDDLAGILASRSAGVQGFSRAVVRVPGSLAYGVLPRRPRRRQTLWESVLLPLASDAKPTWPRGKAIRGMWSWSELAAAHDQGCGITLGESWAHVVPHARTPFAEWWGRIREGRDLGGYTGDLVKRMGNALVGRFFDAPGRRQATRWTGSAGGFDVRDMPGPDFMGHNAPDLAELVTSAVRAELGRVLNANAGRVLVAHTDGGWFSDVVSGFDYEWRAKEYADRIDLLSPSRMAVYPPGGPTDYRFAGRPDARRAFREDWVRVFKVPHDPTAPVVDPRDSELWVGVNAV